MKIDMTTKDKFETERTLTVFLGLLLITAVYVFLRLNLINVPLERDEGIFGYFGQVINHGGLPYLDAIDHKPPVAFYIYALALNWIKPTAQGVHLFAYAYNFLTLLVLMVAARRFSRSNTTAFLTGLTYAVYTTTWFVEGFAATTEVFMLLPLSLSLLTALVATEKRGIFWVAASGFFAALACWTKQVAATSALAIMLYILADVWQRTPKQGYGRPRKIVYYSLMWLLGGFAVSLFLLLPFMLAGIMPEFLYWVFWHGLSYAGQSGGLWENVGSVLKRIWLGLPGDTLPLIIGLIAPWFLLKKHPRESLFVIGFLLMSLLGTLPGYQYSHYFVQLAPAVALATGWSVCELAQKISAVKIRIAAIALMSLLIVGTPVITNRGYYLWGSPVSISHVFYGRSLFPESIEVAKYIREHTSPDDSIFIFGSEPQILFMAERFSATRFVPVFPLFQDFARHREFQMNAWMEVAAAKPKYIVTTNMFESFCANGKASEWFGEQVFKLLHEKYRVIARIPAGDGKNLSLPPTAREFFESDTEGRPYYFIIARRVRE